jgi:hypothetical protein
MIADFLAAPAPQASIPGIFTSVASVITALTVLIGALVGGVKVLAPLIRETRNHTKQLQVIHTLVNSTLTAALASQLDGLTREKLLIGEMVAMGERDGRPASQAQLDALAAVQHKIEELGAAMYDRSQQAKQANKLIDDERIRHGETVAAD